VKDAIAVLRPACAETLPAVGLTITGIIQATEVAAQKVLDEADQLGAHRDRLCEALARLRPHIAPGPDAREACLAVVDAVHGLSAHIDPLVAAMEFQDLSAQHLRAAIETVDALRAALVALLAGMDVAVPAHGAPVRLATKIGTAAGSAPWRQTLADELINDRSATLGGR
jgi:chemotaxis regulatin CheY-phosphate phosphatase CheZ